MAEIFYILPIEASIDKVFEAVSTPHGLDKWWTKESAGSPQLNSMYNLSFGKTYKWTAEVSKINRNEVFELKIKKSDLDWFNTKVGFIISRKGNGTELQFYHTGWPFYNDHYKISSFCWAMYLRLLKRYLEHGEQIEYENRLKA